MRAAYDAIADWYDHLIQTVDPAADLVGSALFAMMGGIRGQRICDLACGQGYLARRLAQQGAQVIGVDLSGELIKLARHYEAVQPLDIQYAIDDATTLSTLADQSVDGVICNLALMDIPDLAATYQSVWRILRPKGWFLFSITHPCFSAPHADWQTGDDGTVSRTIHTYFPQLFWRSTNPHGVRGQVGAYHRTLSTYVNTLCQSGFHLVQLIEPEPAPDSTNYPPGYHVVPIFLIVKATKSL